MKKQLVALVLTAAMLGMALAGCSSAPAAPAAPAATAAEETKEDAKAEEPAAEEAKEEAAADEAKEEDASGITDENVTLRFMWWGNDERHQATIDVIEQYEALHPNVTIEAEYGGFDGYFEKLTTQLSGGTAPDIIQYNANFIGDLLAIGDVFVDLNDYSDYLDVSGFDENALNVFGYAGDKLIALPTGVNSAIFLVNTEVLEKSGYKVEDIKTWDDLIAAGKALHDADPNLYLWNYDIYSLSTETIGTLMAQMTGKDLYDKDAKALNFTRDDLAKAFGVINDLYRNNVLEPAEDSAPYELQIATNPKWINHEFAMATAMTSNIYSGYYDFTDTADVLRTPELEGAIENGVNYRPPQMIAIASTCAYPEVAADFLNYFYNNEEAIKTLKGVRSMQPTVRGQEICSELGLNDPILVKAVEIGGADATEHQNLYTPSEINEIMQDAVEKIAYEQGSVDEITDETMALLEDAVSRQ